MPNYRLYFMDQGGHIGGVVEMACVDDEEATDLARAHHDGRPMELWLRDRKIGAFAGDDVRLKLRVNRIDPGPQGLDP
jgi:hypothetical protein